MNCSKNGNTSVVTKAKKRQEQQAIVDDTIFVFGGNSSPIMANGTDAKPKLKHTMKRNNEAIGSQKIALTSWSFNWNITKRLTLLPNLTEIWQQRPYFLDIFELKIILKQKYWHCC